MFPKLSKKALDEIRRITPKYDFPLNYFDSVMLTDIPDVINAYNSLFDLEKYPITKHMIFEYLRDDLKLPDERQAKLSGSNESTPDYYVFDLSFNKYPDLIDHTGSVMDQITQIATMRDTDKIIIIGEIHGWWEKGETQ